VSDLALQDAVAASQTAKQAPKVTGFAPPKHSARGRRFFLTIKAPITLKQFQFCCSKLLSLSPNEKPPGVSALSHLCNSWSRKRENDCCVGAGRIRRQPCSNLLTWHNIQL